MYKHFFLLFTFTLLTFNLKAQNMYRVTGDDINVRDTNSTRGKVVGSVSQGINVQVLDSADTDYFKIKMTNGEGWISKKFLEKIPVPAVKKTTSATNIVAPKVTSNNNNLIFLSIIMVVLLGMLFIIFKFLRTNVPTMMVSTLVILAMAYFSFNALFLKKAVKGKYVGDSDAQYASFDFKPDHSVVVQDNYADSTFTTSYKIEDDIVTFKQQENIFMLMIMDDSTLVGEGFIKGTFVKD